MRVGIDRVRRHREARRARIGIGRRAREVARPALRQSSIEAPQWGAGERNGAEAGGVLQKVSTTLIHGYILPVRIFVRKKRTMPAGVDRPTSKKLRRYAQHSRDDLSANYQCAYCTSLAR